MSIQKYDISNYYTLEETESLLRDVVMQRYDNINLQQIFKALETVRQAHLGQYRYDNTPFFIHPLRVALMLLKYDKKIQISTSKVLIAALLHDTLEKKCLSPREIEEAFGNFVLKLVNSVTRSFSTLSPEEKRTARLSYLQELILGSHEVRAIKTFENLDNMINWKTIPEDHAAHRKFPFRLEVAREFFLPLAHATDLWVYELMQQEYTYYVERGY